MIVIIIMIMSLRVSTPILLLLLLPFSGCFYKGTCLCGLQGIMCPWFICWFWCSIHYLLFLLGFLHLLPVFFTYFFLTYLLPYLPLPLRIGLLRFQPGGRKRPPNLSLSSFSLFSVIVFLCSWCMVILCCRTSWDWSNGCFTGRISFLPPNHQCQGTEGNTRR